MKCKYCGKRLKERTEFCERCGKEINKDLTEIEEIEKKVRSIGTTINAFGWFGIIVISILSLAFYLDGSTVDLTSTLISLFVSFLLVILGNRIKNVYDKKIKTYLLILLIINMSLTILTWSTVGIGVSALLIYLIYSYFDYRKILKVDEYREALVEKDHKIKKIGWIFIVITIFIIGGFTLNSDMNNLYSDITSDDIGKIVQMIKDSNNLPNRIDEVTVWEDVTAENSAIRYHYTLSNLGDREVSEKLLRDFVGPNICADKDIQNALRGGINMEYLYTVKETAQEFLVVFTEDDCL